MLALQATGVAKHYGGLVALADGRLELAPGEVHVLMGSNGCGKSTLCKIVAGALRLDGGTLHLGGRPATFRSPHEARAAGIATVYQETSLVSGLSVAENIALGREPAATCGTIGRRARDAAIGRLIEATGALAAHLDLRALVADLSIDQRQIVEILKALLLAPRIVILDEATSSLDRAQVAAFFALVRRLRAQGCAVVFISHRIEEIFEIGDRVTIMRSGRHVATMAIAETTREDILRLMVGADLLLPTHSGAASTGPALLEARGVSGGTVRECSLTLHRGEVLGLSGLHGQGQSDLLRALFGAISRTGEIRIDGRPAALASPLAALRAGVAYVSGDRGRAGALGQRGIFENLALTLVAREHPFLLRRGALARRLRPVAARMKTKFASLRQPLSALSGGNQQKIILARALAAAPRAILLDDPTKGIDVEAKRDLYALIAELCREGAGVILYSSEDSELLANADRVLVFNGGRVVDELAGPRLTEFNLYSAALRDAA